MKIPFDKDWLILEKEDYANYLFVFAAWESFTLLPPKWKFPGGSYLGAEYINGECNLFTQKSYHENLARKYYEMLYTSPERWNWLNDYNLKGSNDLYAFSKKLITKHPEKISDHKLIKIIDTFFRHQILVHCPRGPMWCLETPDNLLSSYLGGYLQEISEDRRVKNSSLSAYQTLIVPTRKTILMKEREELLKVALIKDLRRRRSVLSKHADKYKWLEYGLQGRILSEDHFKNELEKIIKKNPGKLLIALKNELSEIKKKQREIIKEYGIGKTHKRIFEIVKGSLFSRIESKYAQFYSYYAIEPILLEFGKRTGLSLEQIRFLRPADYKSALIGNKNFATIATNRKNYSIHIAEKGTSVAYVGQEAKRIRKKMKFNAAVKDYSESTEISGQPAFNGKAKGRVKIINTIQEMAKIHSGNVLVSHMTNPDIVPAMKQAAAIITDLGGITCHAAIVSRELKKPCIIGTKIATKVLKDGDLVEVDANRGIVKIIKSSK